MPNRLSANLRAECAPPVIAQHRHVKADLKRTMLGLRVLLDHGGDLNFRDRDGRTILTKRRDVEILRFYVSRGADLRAKLNLRDDGYYTALSLAVQEAVREHGYQKGGYNDSLFNAAERVKLFVELLGNNSIEGTRSEYHLRYQCMIVPLKAGCQELAKSIKARSPGVFEGQPPPKKS